MKTPPIYGLDFRTTSSEGSIDPDRDQILAIGLATPSGTELYDGDEAELLDLVDRRLGLLPTGVIATWFGSLVGFPMLKARSEKLGVSLQLNMAPDRRGEPSGPLVGLQNPWLANWRTHQHFDLQRSYSERGSRLPIGSRRTPTEAAPDADELVRANPEQNARLVRQLSERRWSQSRRYVDRVPATANPLGDQRTPDRQSFSHSSDR